MYPDARDKGVTGENISTVGVDIGDLILAREGKSVVFHTWDFGGQVRSIIVILCNVYFNISTTRWLYHLVFFSNTQDSGMAE